MKKKLWSSISLVFAVIILSVTAFGETLTDAERTVHSLSPGELSKMMSEAGRTVHIISAGDLSRMMFAQDDAGLAGETISVTGFFGGVFEEGTEDVYGLLYLASVDACCAESVLFFPEAACTEFPERNTIITLTGTLMKREMKGFTALRICDAVLTWDDLPVCGDIVPRRPEDNHEIMLPSQQYELMQSAEVNGRQGVCSEGDCYWVSGSATLSKYDRDWNLIAVNDDPFKGYPMEVNHIGDIDVYKQELYVGAEYFMDGVGKNIQIAVYDCDTLELKRTLPFEPESGQMECSGIAVVPDTRTVWMCSWVGEESGRYLYQYDLDTGAYLGKKHLQMPPQWLQGIACYNGWLYMTADDGNADDGEPDHLYRTKVNDDAAFCTVTLERTFDDVTRQGEIEGLTFDKERGQLLVLYNRGARIVLGMPKGFYDGYDREISEVFTYMLSAPR